MSERFERVFLLWLGIVVCTLARQVGGAVDSSLPMLPGKFVASLSEMGAEDNEVLVERVSRHPPVYRVRSVWKMGLPPEYAVGVALDFSKYPRVFRYVHRCEPVPGPATKIGRHGTWYLEGRARMVRMWAIGNIDTIVHPETGAVLVVASQNSDSLLNTSWMSEPRGWMTFPVTDVDVVGAVSPVGEDSCAIGLFAEVELNMPIPVWLYRLAMKLVLPRILEDFENGVKKARDAAVREVKGAERGK